MIRLGRHCVLGLLALSAAGAANAAPAAPVGGAPDIAGGMLQLAIGLVVVLVVFFAAAWAMRRYGNFNAAGGGALKVVAGLSMGPRERIVLIQVGETQLLVGVAPGRVQTLHVLEQPVAAAEVASPGSFRERLNAALQQRGAGR